MELYLCDNPGQDMPGGVEAHIYAAENPRFFAILMKLDEHTKVSEISYMGTTVIFRYFIPGTKELVHYLLMVKDNIDGAKYEALAGKLKETVEWFVAIIAADAGVEGIGYSFVEPFSPALKPAELIEFRKTGEHLLNFGMGAKGFKDLKSALNFMSKELGIAREAMFVEQTVNFID